MKKKHIDELAGKNPGSFKKFLKDKEEYLKKLEEKRTQRIKACHAARPVAWAA